MALRSIDLNADVGEGYGRWTLGDDAALMPIITSANVACGFHAGDPSTLRASCTAAVAHGVAIGAQVGYPDLVGFGRRFLDIAAGELTDAVLYQIGALDALARASGGRVRYVKPHGALYNTVVDHEAQARAVVDAVATYDPSLPLLGLPGSIVGAIAAARGLRFVAEGFADRGYTEDGRLLPRREPGAVLTDPAAVAAQARTLAARNDVESICVHGDTPGAPALAGAARAALLDDGITLAPFTAG